MFRSPRVVQDSTSADLQDLLLHSPPEVRREYMRWALAAGHPSARRSLEYAFQFMAVRQGMPSGLQ